LTYRGFFAIFSALRRYRLGVRTVGSQPSNRGSNPRSATTFDYQFFP
jgi:hypothetical protein